MHYTYTPRGKTKFSFTRKLDSTIQISQQKYNMKITSFYHNLPHAGGNKVDCKKTPHWHHSTCSWNQEKYQRCFGKNVQNIADWMCICEGSKYAYARCHETPAENRFTVFAWPRTLAVISRALKRFSTLYDGRDVTWIMI